MDIPSRDLSIGSIDSSVVGFRFHLYTNNHRSGSVRNAFSNEWNLIRFQLLFFFFYYYYSYCTWYRYIAITRPFVKNIWSKSFAPIVVSLTWLLGFILSLVIWFFSEATPLITINSADNGNITYYDCRENWGSMTNEQIYTMTLFLIVFAIPLLILIYVYGSITAKLWTHSAPGNRNAARDGAQSRAKRKVCLY